MNHREYVAMRNLLRKFLSRADPPRTCCPRDVAPEVILSRADIEDIRKVLATS